MRARPHPVRGPRRLALPALLLAAVFALAFTPAAARAAACGLATTLIYRIQGSGPAAAVTGDVVVRGVVVGDFEGRSPALRGFYLQDPLGDGDEATSDAIFVFNGNDELLLQQRAPSKPLWPNYWSNTCCSHPRRGEAGAPGAQRAHPFRLDLSRFGSKNLLF